MPLSLAMLLSLAAMTADPAGPVVLVHFVVEDGKGVPVRNLKVEEVRVLQDGDVQRVLTFEGRSQPGHYALTYSPGSGRAGAVTVRGLRGGTVVRGPDGPFLRPKVIAAATALESELAALLDEAAADTLSFRVAALRFERAADGEHHTLAVDVPLKEVHFATREGEVEGRVQVLTRVRDEQGNLRYRGAVEQRLVVGHPLEARVKRLVSTAEVVLAPGRYVFDALARDPATGRLGVRSERILVEEPRPGLRLSSVTLLQDTDVLLARSAAASANDPLTLDGKPLMPSFRPSLPLGVAAVLRFFVILYPDPQSPDPPAADLEVWRKGEMVGRISVKLPARGPDGAIRYSAGIPTHSFRAADYTLRIVARQGEATASEEAAFTISTDPLAPVQVPSR